MVLQLHHNWTPILIKIYTTTIFNEFIKLDFYVHDILENIHSVLQQNKKLKIQIFFV